MMTMEALPQSEKTLVSSVVQCLQKATLPNHIHVESGKRLIYASEVRFYETEDMAKTATPNLHTQPFQTDILIYEKTKQKEYQPRVVIEVKNKECTTHNAITYSHKAMVHKQIHPYLRYGIFVGNCKYLPGLLFRHGAHFDFMISWQSYQPRDYEREALAELINKEIEASKALETVIYKDDKKNYYLLHKRLCLTEQTKTTPDKDT